jgi:rod shape-determining protein MreC
MRNLLNILWKYQFFILFLFFQTLSLTLLFQYNKFQKANLLNQTAEISGSTYLLLNNVTSYLKLKEINEQLLKENKRLRNNSKYHSYYSLHPERMYFNDSLHQRTYNYLGAFVINNSVADRNNYITINKGKQSKISPEMGLVTENGIVGIVKDVSEHFSVALSLLHSKTKISVRLKNSDYFGLVTWCGKSPEVLTLEDIPNHVNIQLGDTVITSGSSSIFPFGIPVGLITNIEKVEGEVFYKIQLKPSQDLRNVHHCYVVENILKTEQTALEEKAQENEN